MLLKGDIHKYVIIKFEGEKGSYTLQNENFQCLFLTAAVYRNIVASIQMF